MILVNTENSVNAVAKKLCTAVRTGLIFSRFVAMYEQGAVCVADVQPPQKFML